MEPVKFKGCNTTFAADQPEYIPLPAHNSKDTHGVITTCWKMSFGERLLALLRGHIFLQQLTFNQPLQPQLPSVGNPLDGYKTKVVKYRETELEKENRYLRSVLDEIKPVPSCPFCEEERPCHHCLVLAQMRGIIEARLARMT